MTRLHRSTTGQVIQMSYEAGFTTYSKGENDKPDPDNSRLPFGEKLER